MQSYNPEETMMAYRYLDRLLSDSFPSFPPLLHPFPVTLCG